MPQAPAQPDVTKPPDHFNVGKVVERMKAAGVPPDQALDQLDQLMPFIQANQKAELDHYRMTLSAQTAAMRAYEAEIRSYKAQTDAEIKRVAEERRTRQGDERTGIKRDELDLKRQREGRLRAAAATGTGTTGPLKATEFIYPKKDDGSADQTGEPIGIRGLTKTGKIVYLDAEGHQTPTLAGITAKQSKASSVAVKDTVRSNLVQGSANNAIRILDNIEKTYPDATTSVIFGQDPKGITESIVHAGARGMQGGRQQAVDAQWAAFIDEAIPVFTGGLRGSDAFRRFLIGQAPGPNAKPEVVKQKMQLFRDNIRGTQRAFSDKFKSDPSMWASGVTKEQVSGGGSAPGEAAAGAEERKTIGGKNYVKRDGQWFEE
jgi:hypothetical protein